jgi:hypothetical protein
MIKKRNSSEQSYHTSRKHPKPKQRNPKCWDDHSNTIPWNWITKSATAKQQQCSTPQSSSPPSREWDTNFSIPRSNRPESYFTSKKQKSRTLQSFRKPPSSRKPSFISYPIRRKCVPKSTVQSHIPSRTPKCSSTWHSTTKSAVLSREYPSSSL